MTAQMTDYQMDLLLNIVNRHSVTDGQSTKKGFPVINPQRWSHTDPTHTSFGLNDSQMHPSDTSMVGRNLQTLNEKSAEKE